MPIDLNENHDIHMMNGNLVLNSDRGTVGQDIKTRLLFFKGEWRFDIDDGTPWLQVIFKKPFNLALAQSATKARILGTKGVDKLNSFLMDYTASTRKLRVTFNVTTVYGELQFNNVEIPNV